MGCIGMSRDDFCRCTPLEFYEAWRQWAEHHKEQERCEWERARLMGMFFIQPYVKGTLAAHDVLPLPWDADSDSDKEEISREEFNRRFEEAKRRNGLK